MNGPTIPDLLQIIGGKEVDIFILRRHIEELAAEKVAVDKILEENETLKLEVKRLLEKQAENAVK